MGTPWGASEVESLWTCIWRQVSWASPNTTFSSFISWARQWEITLLDINLLESLEIQKTISIHSRQTSKYHSRYTATESNHQVICPLEGYFCCSPAGAPWGWVIQLLCLQLIHLLLYLPITLKAWSWSYSNVAANWPVHVEWPSWALQPHTLSDERSAYELISAFLAWAPDSKHRWGTVGGGVFWDCVEREGRWQGRLIGNRIEKRLHFPDSGTLTPEVKWANQLSSLLTHYCQSWK